MEADPCLLDGLSFSLPSRYSWCPTPRRRRPRRGSWWRVWSAMRSRAPHWWPPLHPAPHLRARPRRARVLAAGQLDAVRLRPPGNSDRVQRAAGGDDPPRQPAPARGGARERLVVLAPLERDRGGREVGRSCRVRVDACHRRPPRPGSRAPELQPRRPPRAVEGRRGRCRAPRRIARRDVPPGLVRDGRLPRSCLTTSLRSARRARL